MARMDKFDTLSPQSYSCIVCSTPIDGESRETEDKQGNRVLVYSPTSRYWHDDGVFCSAQCGLDYCKSN